MHRENLHRCRPPRRQAPSSAEEKSGFAIGPASDALPEKKRKTEKNLGPPAIDAFSGGQ